MKIFLVIAIVYVLLLLFSLVKKNIQSRRARKKDNVVPINVQPYINRPYKKPYLEEEMLQIGRLTAILLSDKEKVEKAVKEN